MRTSLLIALLAIAISATEATARKAKQPPPTVMVPSSVWQEANFPGYGTVRVDVSVTGDGGLTGIARNSTALKARMILVSFRRYRQPLSRLVVGSASGSVSDIPAGSAGQLNIPAFSVEGGCALVMDSISVRFEDPFSGELPMIKVNASDNIIPLWYTMASGCFEEAQSYVAQQKVAQAKP
jgi:hypothetical protein